MTLEGLSLVLLGIIIGLVGMFLFLMCVPDDDDDLSDDDYNNDEEEN